MLILSPEQLRVIQNHGMEAYPDECCGLLLGTYTQQAAETLRTTVKVWPADNIWTAEIGREIDALTDLAFCEGSSEAFHPDLTLQATPTLSHQNRYWIDPKFLLKAQRYCSDCGLSIIGVYHSHPGQPAIPSDCDRALAWPHYSYLILSVEPGVEQDYRSWCLDDCHHFQSEPILIHQ